MQCIGLLVFAGPLQMIERRRREAALSLSMGVAESGEEPHNILECPHE